jgi:nucleoside-diphosphate-sugar epimerase
MQTIKRVLITGAIGQIGTELTKALRERYGADNVIATDCRTPSNQNFLNSGHFQLLNVLDVRALDEIILKNNIDTIFHLAAILSATGEDSPQKCWEVNMNGTLNVLELGVKQKLTRVIIPSSIAVWGAGAPPYNTPQESVLKPYTMYGITKVCGELLGDYYARKFGLDVRGLRYPGIISAETLPGGGTTDYAVAIYYEAVEKGHYTCFVKEDTVLPMMYMPDCIKAAMDLAEADFDRLKHHSDFNVSALSFDAKTLADSIKKYLPHFTVEYEPDHRQAIADSWPKTVDDSCARQEWGWKPEWDLERMTKDMIEKLSQRKKKGKLYL